jgi:hypothetical protein
LERFNLSALWKLFCFCLQAGGDEIKQLKSCFEVLITFTVLGLFNQLLRSGYILLEVASKTMAF